MLIWVLPGCTFWIVKLPFASATAHCSVEVSTIVANSTGCPVSLLTTVPLMLYVFCWANAAADIMVNNTTDMKNLPIIQKIVVCYCLLVSPQGWQDV